MKNYVTTTLAGLGQLLLGDGIQLYVGTDSAMQTCYCTDANSVHRALAMLQQNQGMYTQPQVFPHNNQFGGVGSPAPWATPFQSFYSPNQNQQFERICFVCEIELDSASNARYLKIYNEAFPHNCQVIPVSVNVKKPTGTDAEAKACSDIYDDTFSSFCAGIQNGGVLLKTGECAKGRFIGCSDAPTVSGMVALQAIYAAIRMVDGHRSVSNTQQIVDISTGRPSGYELAYELLEGHRSLKVYFKDYPSLFVTIAVRRIG